MEFPRRAVIAERVLAAALLAAALGAAWAENGSVLAARTRDGAPWLAWIEARERGHAAPPSFHLAVYDPTRRRLALLHLPGEFKIEGRRTLERSYVDALKRTSDPDAAARVVEDLADARLRELSPEPLPAVSTRFAVEIAPPSPQDEPSVQTARELKARGQRPRVWAALARNAARGLRAGDRTALDPLLFALELRRARFEDMQPARLPSDAEASVFLGRLLATKQRVDDERMPIVEILNGTEAPSLASRAAKVLRLKNVDVLTTANVPRRARTLVYDRVGDFARAEKMRVALGCPSARTATRLDASRAVDVSIELGDDCAGTFGPVESREP